jgi:PAS domain-containing protein
MEFAQLVTRTEFDLDALLENRDWWIVVLDQEQRVTAANDVCRPILGLEGNGLRTSSSWDISIH